MVLAPAASTYAFDGHHLMAAMLRHEAASATVLADMGLINPDAAQSISNTCKPVLFSVDVVLRDTLRLQPLSPLEPPPLMLALRETVRLFNPQASEHVFRGGLWAALQRNALACLTQELTQDLLAHMDALLTLLEPSTPLAQPLLQARLRLAGAAERALWLELALQDPEALADAQGYIAGMSRQLGLSNQSHLIKGPQTDAMAVLGCEFAVLMICTGRLATHLPWPASQVRLVDRLRSQALRAPLLASQWMTETCARDEGRDDQTSFWQHQLPLWSQLAGQAALGVRDLYQAWADSGEKPAAGHT